MNKNKQKPVPQKQEKNKKEDSEITLIIDTDPKPYLDQENVLVIDPRFSSQFKCLRRNQFGSCTIKNSSVDDLGGAALSFIFDSLKENGTLTVHINQPISTLVKYDYNQLKASAEYAGFGDIQCGQKEVVEGKKKQIVEDFNILTGIKVTQNFEEQENKQEKKKGK